MVVETRNVQVAKRGDAGGTETGKGGGSVPVGGNKDG